MLFGVDVFFSLSFILISYRCCVYLCIGMARALSLAVCLKEVDPAGYFTSRKVYYRRPFRESLSLAEVSYLRLYLILKVSGRKQKEIEEKRGRKGGRVGMDKER